VRSLTRRYLTVIVAMAVVAPIALFLQFDVPPPSDVKVLDAIPKAIGPWSMLSERGPTDEEREILETDAILTRTYSRGQSVQCDLSVVFARDNRRVAHPPEICYKGSGWTVERRSIAEFAVDGKPFRANRLLLLRGDARLLVLYWYKAGAVCTENYLKMQWNIIKTHFARRGSSSALCRVSAMSSAPHEDETVVATLREFAAQAIPAVNAAID
jgi:EpsI family protein